MEKEPNTSPNVDETIDKFLDEKEGGEQPGESSPSPEQPEGQPEDGSGPEKTPSTADAGKEKDRGFADHPAWKEREAKLKEAQAKLDEAERQNSQLSRLLDDPSIYRKYLQAQGVTDEASIRRALAERGLKEEAPASQGSIAEVICKKLGWDISRLDAKQREYIEDQISLAKAVAEETMGKSFDERFKKVEGFISNADRRERESAEWRTVQSRAKEEFPELDFNKDLEPAMNKYLDEFDKRSPNVYISPTELYEKATRELLKEKRISAGRQEERDGLKKNARPLRPVSPPTKPEGMTKGKNAKETADAFLDAAGIK